jgi:hypothetical protein
LPKIKFKIILPEPGEENIQKVTFKMILPEPGEENIQQVTFKCATCKESMALDEIDGHAKKEHNATSVTVDTTT